MEATRNPVKAEELIKKAIESYRNAVAALPLESIERANARLGLARALGESGDQARALSEFDLACSELAHLGSPLAKVLIDNREIVEAQQWQVIGLE